jgi:hypothetical protein
MGGHPKWHAAAEYGPSDPASGVAPNDAARRAIAAVLGKWVLEPQPELGRPEPVDAADGRGASGWIPVLEWMGDQTAGELFTILGWEVLRRLGTSAAALVDRIKREDKAEIQVSLGMAVLLAIAHVQGGGEPGPLHVEVAEETTTLARREPGESNYVGYEPWIVLLVSRRTRYVVVVTSNGDIAGSLAVPMSEAEVHYLPFEWPK